MLNFNEIRAYFAIKRSGLFEEAYYLKMYPDVRLSGINPLIHFIKFGWKEKRNPSQFFDTNYYMSHNKDVQTTGINPLLHYLKFGGVEGRNPSDQFNSKLYLDNNQDVKSAGINPLVHYLNFGMAEGRPPHAITASQFEISINTSSNSLEKTLSSIELTQRIQGAKKSGNLIISISNDDYLQTKGGMQIFISHEQQTHNQNETNYLHVYPSTGNKILMDEDVSLIIGVNLNGKYLGTSTISTFVTSIQATILNVVDVSIHHTMGLNISTINKILTLNNNNGNFWIHDYFTLCPSYNLLRNDREFCGAPDVNSNACSICKYRELRIKQREKFECLFNESNLKIISPSRFALDFWSSKSSYPISSSEVFPIAKLKWTGNSDIKRTSNHIHIGFPGYPIHSKGWETWIRFVNSFRKDEFKFYHFSSLDGTAGNFERIDTAVTPDKTSLMIDLLVKYRIDAVLLWSIWPETFSITLHEALAAGCFIITNKMSGNIQDYLMKNPTQGVVLKNEEELIDFVKSGELKNRILEFQTNGKPKADLVWMEGES